MGQGPLNGIRIVEIAGIGPGPFAAMLLADLGADIVRVDRLEAIDLGVAMEPRFNIGNRGRRSVAVDLKKPDGIATVLRLVEKADALIEGFRPGVMERLGLGPEICLARNPRLVYGRMTGWGQTGPLAPTAGHDINYISIAGALHAIGRAGEKPVPPLNLVGDYGGGALYLALGLACGIIEASRSGKGQVVDAAMVDGAASLMTLFYGMNAGGLWADARGENMLDTGAPWYDVYETKDGKYVSIGSIEGRFYAELIDRLGLKDAGLPKQHDQKRWPELRATFTEVFKGKTRDEWCAVMDGSDVCFAPVLSLEEAPRHRHNAERGAFISIDGVNQPAPAPRFSRTPGGVQRPPAKSGEHTAEALADWGFAAADIAQLTASGAVG
jgi:alpha-methylacyl-CoA racemase